MNTTAADQRAAEQQSRNDETAQVLELDHLARKRHPSWVIDQGATVAEQGRALGAFLWGHLGPGTGTGTGLDADTLADQLADQFGPEQWATAAERAGLPRPTSAVQAMAVRNIRARADHSPTDPFDGLGGAA